MLGLIRELDREEFSRADQLLADLALPPMDRMHPDCHYLACWRDGRLIALGGLEIYQQDVLLRSLAVSKDCQGSGMGTHLLTRLLQRSRTLGLHQIFLLTTSAAAFFAGQGFQTIPRSKVPALIAASSQFAGVCPASATCMVLQAS